MKKLHVSHESQVAEESVQIREIRGDREMKKEK